MPETYFPVVKTVATNNSHNYINKCHTAGGKDAKLAAFMTIERQNEQSATAGAMVLLLKPRKLPEYGL